MAEIINISDLDKYGEGYGKAIDRALIASAYRIRDKAVTDLLSKYPKTEKFKNGIFVGKLNNNKIVVSAFGNKGKEDYKARFFVGGTKERKDDGGYRKTREGIKYVQYKKSMSKGRINPTNSLSIAFESQRESIKQFFNNLEIKE